MTIGIAILLFIALLIVALAIVDKEAAAQAIKVCFGVLFMGAVLGIALLVKIGAGL